MPHYDHYVRYNDAIEVRQEDEEALIEKIVASMGRVNRSHFDKYRHGIRDAHAKSHGVLTGTLTVYDGLAVHLRQGVFAEPRSYPIAVRFSSAPGDFQSDGQPALRGMAIKMIGVEGPQVLPEHHGEKTQDWLLVNHPVIPFGHVAAYWKAQQFAERQSQSSELSHAVTSKVIRGAAKVLQQVGAQHETLKALAPPNHHILGETFHSMAALRFGDHVAKLSAAPLSENVRKLTGQPIDADSPPSILRDLAVAFFEQQGAEYELRAQLCTDLEKMPVEDASIEWPEHLSPHQPIAKLTFPPQDAYSPARRIYADDVLSFNPWHCIEAHRPLGSIMRVRRNAYESSSRFRHEMNDRPRVEPKDITDVPGGASVGPKAP
ncbi:catalase family protein [Stigmatella sp. ncwal1]|uniref:Catalase family protein n=1 Tax=Stigmatella ashevillensis TaxID=2995309 RepID=A0ABT5DIV6_9BACT|nr:catalase family protein [Stigmatella ashevillena]MDC0712262.1 catalase family protein [Stigmatella ashevillena]